MSYGLKDGIRLWSEDLAGDHAYDEIKRQMCARMWRFAYQENDSAINPYITVGLAPFGPALAFSDP